MKEIPSTTQDLQAANDSPPVAAALPHERPWHPKIVALLCNWCSYTGADLAGISRIPWSPEVRIVRVLCSGRLDPTLVAQVPTASSSRAAIPATAITAAATTRRCGASS